VGMGGVSGQHMGWCGVCFVLIQTLLFLVARSREGGGGGGGGGGVARIFQSGVTPCQSEGTHKIVMSFSSAVVGCLLKSLQKGRSQAPQDPSGYAPERSTAKLMLG